MIREAKAHPQNLRSLNLTGSLDTTFLLEDLKRRFQEGGDSQHVSFRELANWVKSGDQLTHQIHPYPAKLLPHIANFFLRASSICRKGDYVLDPFCGSGTVALEASLVGAMPLVADANPFALLVTKVKTYPYVIEELVNESRSLRLRIARLRKAPHIPVVNEEIWYQPLVKQKLEIILRAIFEINDDDIRDFFKVCFSVAARKLSNADPAVNVPVRLKEKPNLTDSFNKKIRAHLDWLKNADVLTEFEKIVQANIERVHAANNAAPSRMKARIVGTDARSLTGIGKNSSEANRMSLTITSPPYGSAQKYIRATSLSLNWLSLCHPSELSKMEATSIGREHISVAQQVAMSLGKNLIPARFADEIDRIAKINPLRASITATYLIEMHSALHELKRTTSHNGNVIIIIGNNTVAGQSLRNDLFIIEIMKSLGFSLDLILNDRIHSRGLITARNKNAAIIPNETVLMFKNGNIPL